MTPEEFANRQFALQKAIDVAGFNDGNIAVIVEAAEKFLDFLQDDAN